jgi:hypothetical protein
VLPEGSGHGQRAYAALIIKKQSSEAFWLWVTVLLESVEAHVNGPLDAWPIGQLQHELLKLTV